MPPPDSKKSLTPEQRDILRRWVEQGARYQKHWAFEPIERPAVPDGAEHPIDAFLGARLHEVVLTPRPEADRETLKRIAHMLGSRV